MLLQYIEYQFVIRALYDSMAWSGKKEQFSCVPIATLHFSLKNRPPLIPLCEGEAIYVLRLAFLSIRPCVSHITG